MNRKNARRIVAVAVKGDCKIPLNHAARIARAIVGGHGQWEIAHRAGDLFPRTEWDTDTGRDWSLVFPPRVEAALARIRACGLFI
jgi:hypothetical protein